MSYGISIKNDSGYTNIDENFSNLQVLTSGTVSAPGLVTFEAQAVKPVVMVCISTNSIWDDTARPILPLNENSQFRVGSAVTQNVKYKVLIPRINLLPSSETYGFRVKGPSAELFFDSGNLDTLAVNVYATVPYMGPNGMQYVAISDFGGDVYVSLSTLRFFQSWKDEVTSELVWKSIAVRLATPSIVQLAAVTSYHTGIYNPIAYMRFIQRRYLLVGNFS